MNTEVNGTGCFSQHSWPEPNFGGWCESDSLSRAGPWGKLNE